MQKLKIGLDFHGVITDNPEFFRDFSAAALGKGHEVHVISGGATPKLNDYLKAWNIKHTGSFSLVEYFKKTGQIEFFGDGDFHVPDNLWDRAKAEYCRDNKISVQIDDTPRYKQFFTTPFAYYDAKLKACTLGKDIIDLSVSADDSIIELEQALDKPDDKSK